MRRRRTARRDPRQWDRVEELSRSIERLTDRRNATYSQRLATSLAEQLADHYEVLADAYFELERNDDAERALADARHWRRIHFQRRHTTYGNGVYYLTDREAARLRRRAVREEPWLSDAGPGDTSWIVPLGHAGPIVRIWREELPAPSASKARSHMPERGLVRGWVWVAIVGG